MTRCVVVNAAHAVVLLAGGFSAALASNGQVTGGAVNAWRPLENVGDIISDPNLKQQLLDEANAHVRLVAQKAHDRIRAIETNHSLRHMHIDAAAILTEVDMHERDRHEAEAEFRAGGGSPGDEIQATRIFTENPMTDFSFDNTNTWVPWPGMSKGFQLDVDALVLIQYQTATPGGTANIFSRLVVDGTPVKATASAAGNTKYASNFGFLSQYLASGTHNVTVEYLTGFQTNDVRFEHGGSDWMTRALNVVVLPAAYSDANLPFWRFRISSADVYMTIPGLRETLELEEPTPTLAFFTFVIAGKNSMLSSKILLNNIEQKSSRAVAGTDAYSQTTGFFAGTVPPGTHEFQVVYRTPGKSNYFDPMSLFQARALYIIQLPGATIYNKYDDAAMTLAEDEWAVWPGLVQEFNLPSPRTVMVTYSIAMQSMVQQVFGSVRSRLMLNDMEQKQTRSVCGESSYCQNNGFWVGLLPAGKHEFKVMYRAARVLSGDRLTMPEGNKDWANRAMNVVVLPRPGIVT